MMTPIRQLVLFKGEYTFQFTFHRGCETDLISEIALLAADDETPFDWCDAAVLSHELERMSQTMESDMICALVEPIR